MLASESAQRKALLAQAGIEPDAIVPAHIDESARKGELARMHALRLAKRKALAVAAQAETNESVRHCLQLLSGRSHQVLTAVAIVKADGSVISRTVMTRVNFARLTPQTIDAYVSSHEGLGKAGGYAIQGKAEIFVRQMNGSYSNVVGLPLFETVNLLMGCGYRFP